MLERMFRLKEHGTNVQTEVVAGLTTFMTMAYIIFVNPNIVKDTGMPVDGVLIATVISAAVATLTAGGQSTDEVVTALTATMSSMLKPSEDLANKLEEMGFNSGTAAIKTLGFAETLKQLTEGMSQADIAAFFPNVRALRAVFPLIGSLSEKFNSNLEEMGSVAGATDEAFGKMQKGIAFKLAQLRQVGEKVLRRVGEQFANLVEMFLDAPKVTQNVILSITALGVAFKFLGTKLTIIAGLVGFVFRTMETNFMGLGELFAKIGAWVTHIVNVVTVALTTISNIQSAILSGSFDELNNIFKEGHASIEREQARHNSIMININKQFLEKYTDDWKTFIPDISHLLGMDEAGIGKVAEQSAKVVATVQENLLNPLETASRMTYEKNSQEEIATTEQTVQSIYKIRTKSNNEVKTLHYQMAKLAANQFVNTVGHWATSEVSKLFGDFISKQKTAFGRLWAQILQGFIQMIVSMTARFLAFKVLTGFGVPSWFFVGARGGIVDRQSIKPVRAQTGVVAQGLIPYQHF